MVRFFPLLLLSVLTITSCDNSTLYKAKTFMGLNPEVSTPPSPIEVFIAQDMSGSRTQNGIPLITESDLDNFIALALDKERGGRIGFMIIDAQSKDEPVVSIKIRSLVKPVKPEHSKHAATQAKRMKEYKKAINLFQQDSANICKQRPLEIAQFKQEVLRRLAYAERNPPVGTDVMSALNTATLFLNGGNSDATQTAIFLSDGIDNQYGKVVTEPESTVEFLWVSGTPIPEKIPAPFRTATKTTVSDALDYITLD